MISYKFYTVLREEQRELAARIGRLEQVIDDHDNKGMSKEFSDDYMDLLRDQLESMKDYNSCLIHRIGIAVTEGIAPLERSRCNQAILRDVKKFRETDPRDLAKQNPAKQDSDKVVADEDERNFGFYFAASIL